MPKKWFFPGPRLAATLALVVLLLLAALFSAAPALAHRALVFAYAEGDTIHTESKFVPNTPVRQGEIKVLEQKSGRVILTGKTDDKGKFSFKIPAAAAAAKMDLKIVLEAGLGHQGEWLLKASSYLPAAKAGNAAPPSGASPAAAPGPRAPGASTATLDSRQMEEVVNKALERQLAPLKGMLTDLTIHRTTLTDIIGGLGYILGIFGLWAYFQSKRKRDS